MSFSPGDDMTATVEFDPFLLDTRCIVDVRTPLEYAEDRLPGAVNVPLLTNEERVEIGTLHKQEGPLRARRRGLELTAARFPAIVEEIAAHAAGREVVVYCWRGGLRSRTVTDILDLTGFPAVQLKGGYRAFRNIVAAFFDDFITPVPLVVLHGMTGTGKTTFLTELEEQGSSVIDLEGLAQHRGSAFGEVGISQDIPQKRFETLLWEAFRRLPPGKPVFLEGESRRIGDIFLPGNLYDRMQDGILVWCEASLETRVRRLMDDYGREEYRDELRSALNRIIKRLGGEKHRELNGYLDEWLMEPFMRELMTSYYDRLYYKTRSWTEHLRLSLEDYGEAAGELERFLASALPYPCGKASS
jgi:tRNA 2-selenouridine synthase